MGARIVIEEEAAGRIGATTHRGVGAFDEEFSGGTGDGREKPLEAAFTSNELEAPAVGTRDEFVVAFSESEQVVDGLDPNFREGFFLDERSEDGAERLAETQNFEENGVDGLRLVGEEGMKASGALWGDDAGVDEEGDELAPREVMGRGRGIGEIESEAASDEGRGLGME